MRKRNTFVWNSLHFLLRSGILEGKTNQTLHVFDGGFKFRDRRRPGNLLPHFARFVESDHGRVETVGITIENDIHSTTTGSGDHAVLKTNVESNNTHCKLLLIMRLVSFVCQQSRGSRQRCSEFCLALFGFWYLLEELREKK
mmetsp:Transcript_16153/g.44727  ORF Transcript_16153/g.44727 Transcript_16153/m.44727 type:complete len:142 (-) Transcript_16153:8-433(-)